MLMPISAAMSTNLDFNLAEFVSEIIVFDNWSVFDA